MFGKVNSYPAYVGSRRRAQVVELCSCGKVGADLRSSNPEHVLIVCVARHLAYISSRSYAFLEAVGACLLYCDMSLPPMVLALLSRIGTPVTCGCNKPVAENFGKGTLGSIATTILVVHCEYGVSAARLWSRHLLPKGLAKFAVPSS